MTISPSALPLELRSLVDQLHGAHIVIDADFRIVAANDEYRKAFGSGADVVGQSLDGGVAVVAGPVAGDGLRHRG